MNTFIVAGYMTSNFIPTKTEGCYEFYLEEDDKYKNVQTHKFIIFEKFLPKRKNLKGHFVIVKGRISSSQYNNYYNTSLRVLEIEICDSTTFEKEEKERVEIELPKATKKPRPTPVNQDVEETSSNINEESKINNLDLVGDDGDLPF